MKDIRRRGALATCLAILVATPTLAAVTEHTDLGLMLSGGLYDSDTAALQFAGWLQLRQRVAGPVGMLLGVGGLVAQTGYTYANAWDGYLYPTFGLSFDLPRTTLEARFSPGEPGALLVDHASLWVGFRRAL